MMKILAALVCLVSLVYAVDVSSRLGNERWKFVETVMSNPDRLDSICRHTPIAQEYAREYLGHVQSRLDLVRELRNFNGEYEMSDAEGVFQDLPARGHNIRLYNDITGRSVDFQFHSPDGRHWRLNNLVIESCFPY